MFEVSAAPADLLHWDIFKNIDRTLFEKIQMFHVFESRVGIKGNNALFSTTDGQAYGIKMLNPTNPSDVKAIPLKFLDAKGVQGFTSGDGFVVALTKDGHVYTSGDNDRGLLGYKSKEPDCVLFERVEVIQQVSCGRWHVLALTDKGKLYCWGDNSFGQCGISSVTSISLPVVVPLPDSVVVASVACGMYHSAAITTTGKVYTWGLGANLKDVNNLNEDAKIKPQLVTTIEKKSVGVVCGTNHTVILTEDGKLFASVFKSGGYIEGEGGTNSLNRFKSIADLPRINSIVSDWKNNFTVAQSDNKAIVIKCCSVEDGETIEKIEKKNLKRNIEVFYNNPVPCCSIKHIVYKSCVPFINIEMFLNNTYLSDVVIEVKNFKLYCHSFILKIKCPYFEELLEKAPETEGRKVLKISSQTYGTYRSFIKYLYSGIIDQNADQFLGLWELSKIYSVDSLRLILSDNFNQVLTIANAAVLYEQAYKKKLTEMQSIIRDFVTENYIEVFCSPGLQTTGADVVKDMVINVFKALNGESTENTGTKRMYRRRRSIPS